MELVSLSARFLTDFVTTVEPLRKLTRQGTKRHWAKEENEAFEALENQLDEASMMAFYDKEAPTDARPVVLEAIRVQENQEAVNATPRAMTTREIERASAEDEELTEVRRCWKTGDWSADW